MCRWSTSRTIFFLLIFGTATLFHRAGLSWHGDESFSGADPAGKIGQRVKGMAGVHMALNSGGDGDSLLNQPFDFENSDLSGFPPVCEDPEGGEVEAIRLDVIGTRFHCTESQCEHHYDNCIVEIDYELSAETRPDLKLEASVGCSADITYGTGHGYILTGSTDSNVHTHSLKPRLRDAHHLSMCFKFSRYEEVITAQLDSVKCRIKKVDLK